MSKTAAFTVTGPGVYKECESGMVGLSFAITCASHAAKGRLEETFYVDAADGTRFGFAEAFSDGTVDVRRSAG